MKADVLTHGYVELIDVMGTDRDIAQAAWVSTEHERPGEDRSDEAVRRVLRYMMAHGHTSPFEMAEVKFKIMVPMDAWRQWIRHRTANVNEYSTRYSPAIDLFHTTQPSEWRIQDTGNHQGSADEMVERQRGMSLSNEEAFLHETARRVYKRRLASGVAKEQARKDLPLSTYTVAYWKTDLHNLLHFLELRLDPHAQQEIRAYAEVIAVMVKELFPLAWEAFEDYRLLGVRLSRMEYQLVRHLLRFYLEERSYTIEERELLYEMEDRMTSREKAAMDARWGTAISIGQP